MSSHSTIGGPNANVLRGRRRDHRRRKRNDPIQGKHGDDLIGAPLGCDAALWRPSCAGRAFMTVLRYQWRRAAPRNLLTPRAQLNLQVDSRRLDTGVQSEEQPLRLPGFRNADASRKTCSDLGSSSVR